MKKIITNIVIIAAVVTGAAAVLGAAIAAWVHDSNNNNQVAGLLGNIPGVTNQDIRLCRGSYINGGKYYHQFYDVKLTCTRQHIEVEFDHSSED